MKNMFLALFTLTILFFGVRVFAACPCQIDCSPCPCPASPCAQPCQTTCCDPCECVSPCNPCCNCEEWLDCNYLTDYFCRMCFNDCQKAAALNAIERFKCCTQCLRAKGYQCELKCECRAYRRALRDLDCDMKNIITRCQRPDYRCVRREIKDKVKCCHSCLIWPFKLCKCCNNCCGCGCNCDCGCK